MTSKENKVHVAINFNEIEQHVHIVEEEIKMLTILRNQLQLLYDVQIQNGLAVSQDLQKEINRVERMASRARMRIECLRNMENDFRRADEEIHRKLEEMIGLLSRLPD